MPPVSINEPQTPSHEEIAGAEAPTITSLDPASAAVGDADFTLTVHGEGFTAASVIYFAGHDEPTELGDGAVSTGVKPSLWQSPCKVQVYVHNGTMNSEPLEFEFTAPAEDTRKSYADDPNELMLDSMYPTHVQIAARKDFTLNVVGRGFTRDCVILFDDEEVETHYLNHGQLYTTLPMATEPGEVDVEVQRGDETSDVLTFEFTHALTPHKPKQRKPKKTAPSHKRTKKR